MNSQVEGGANPDPHVAAGTPSGTHSQAFHASGLSVFHHRLRILATTVHEVERCMQDFNRQFA